MGTVAPRWGRIGSEVEGPEQHHYTPILQQDLEAAITRVAAARFQARINWAKYPTKTGDRSARFQVVTTSGDCIFIKALGTRHEITQSFLEHETFVLRALNANPPEGFHVPTLLDHGIEAYIPWMATEWMDAEEKLLLTAATFQPLVIALRAIRGMPADLIVGHTCRKNDEAWRPSTYWSNIDDTTRRLARHDVGFLKPEYRDRIMHFLNNHIDQIEDLYESRRIYPAHGDFAPGNLTMRGGTVTVLDWESSHLDPGPIDVAHYVSTRAAWRSELADRLEAALWEGPPEVLILAKIERLAGRANDTYQRRRRRDDNALLMLEDLVQRDLPA
jgi:hypothetical protein